MNNFLSVFFLFSFSTENSRINDNIVRYADTHYTYKCTMTLSMKIIGFVSLLLLMIGDLSDGKTESRLRVGKSINVFVRYGYLGISMKVISYNDTERWLFKEPTNNVFLVSLPRVCSVLSFAHILVSSKWTAASKQEKC